MEPPKPPSERKPANPSPKWWTAEHASAWERVRATFRRDWEQRKSKGRAELADAREAWEQAEREARYGFAARARYADRPEWNPDLEDVLQSEWDELDTGTPWESARTGIRRGWEYPHRARSR